MSHPKVVVLVPIVLGMLVGCESSGGRRRDLADGGHHVDHAPADRADADVPGHETSQDGGGWGGDDAAVTPRPDGTCDVPAHCPPLQDPCQQAICVNHTCHVARQAEGTPVQDEAGNCVRLVCDAQGAVAVVLDAQDVPADDGDPCTRALCEAGTGRHLPLPPGAALPEDSQIAGDCQELQCDQNGDIMIAGKSTDTPEATDACRVPVCDGLNPSSEPARVGTDCGTGAVCDGDGRCIACIDQGGSCGANWHCCSGECSATGKCVAGPEPDGGVEPGPCDEDEACCEQAKPLGELSGDTDGAALVHDGKGSGMFSLAVTEDDHAFLAPRPLGVSVRLQSSTLHRFVIYGSGAGCDTKSVISKVGTDVSETFSWPDDMGIAGADGGRTLHIEVLSTTGASSNWTMTLLGNP